MTSIVAAPTLVAPPVAADLLARTTAMTAIDRTLLLAAGAGSGKTSVLAGRVVSLLAAGVPPAAVAAISFTELSAAELRERIERFVNACLAGAVPDDLRPAFPSGLDAAQHAHLEQARTTLDEIVCSTIHGFCRILISPWPVEADIDPGATVVDEGIAAQLLDEVRTRWLWRRLSAPGGPAAAAGDAFLRLWLSRGRQTRALLDTLLAARHEKRWTHVVSPATVEGAAVAEIGTAVVALQAAVAQWAAADQPWAPGGFSRAGADLARFTADLVAQLAGAGPLDSLLAVLAAEIPPSCLNKGQFAGRIVLKTTQKEWGEAAKAVGLTDAEGKRRGQAADAAREAAAAAVKDLMAAPLAWVTAVVGEAVEDIVRTYADEKRASARMDYGDLLERARDLLASNDAVRLALAARHRHVLVDEFQDTDGMQVEILWRLCGDPARTRPVGAAYPGPVASWQEWALRPGALFAVGDHLQSIYRFRGAEPRVFAWARAAITVDDPTAVLSITRNFRSLTPVLAHVNTCFQPVFAGSPGGYAPLWAASPVVPMHPGVAAIPVHTVDGDSADACRWAEATAIAQALAGLVGHLDVRGRDGTMRPCRPGDVAVLVPAGTELWVYERALERVDLPVVCPAAKSVFLRQEIQDLVALARTLASPSDTMALASFLRGPLVGLTDEILLDAVHAAPVPAGARRRLHLHMELSATADPVLVHVMEILRQFSRRRPGTTPYQLLSGAVDELDVRATLRAHGGRSAERALANVELFLEMSRGYAVRGMRGFVADMTANWSEATRSKDGHVDADGSAVTLMTIHGAKGLEWPVVVMAKMMSPPETGVDCVTETDGRLWSVNVFGRAVPAAEPARQQDEIDSAEERQRLVYVAMTRARDLLLLPRHGAPAKANYWVSQVDLQMGPLLPWVPLAADPVLPPSIPEVNDQDPARWAAEQATIDAATRHYRRVTPHRADAAAAVAAVPVVLGPGSEGAVGLEPPPPVSVDGAETVADETAPALAVAAAPVVGAGRIRGLVLHKLLEEVLTGELEEDRSALSVRARDLLTSLADGSALPAPEEVADLALRALGVPEVELMRRIYTILPECPMATELPASPPELIVGVSDAVVLASDGTVEGVIDWKSDVEPDEETMEQYRAQVRAYVRATGAKRGHVVYANLGTCDTVGVDALAPA